MYRCDTSRGNSLCHNLNAYVPPTPILKFLCWKPNAQCDGFKMGGFEKWLDHEGRNLVTKSRPYTREPTMLLNAFHCVRTQQKVRRWSLSEPDHDGTLILDFWSLELWERRFWLHKPPNLWYFVTAAQMDLDNTYYLISSPVCSSLSPA